MFFLAEYLPGMAVVVEGSGKCLLFLSRAASRSERCMWVEVGGTDGEGSEFKIGACVDVFYNDIICIYFKSNWFSIEQLFHLHCQGIVTKYSPQTH